MVWFPYPITVDNALARCRKKISRVVFPPARPLAISACQLDVASDSEGKLQFAFVYSRVFEQFFLFIDTLDFENPVYASEPVRAFRIMNVWAVAGGDRLALVKRNVHVVSGSPVYTSPESSYRVFYKLLNACEGNIIRSVEEGWVKAMRTYDELDALSRMRGGDFSDDYYSDEFSSGSEK